MSSVGGTFVFALQLWGHFAWKRSEHKTHHWSSSNWMAFRQTAPLLHIWYLRVILVLTGCLRWQSWLSSSLKGGQRCESCWTWCDVNGAATAAAAAAAATTAACCSGGVKLFRLLMVPPLPPISPQPLPPPPPPPLPLLHCWAAATGAAYG